MTPAEREAREALARYDASPYHGDPQEQDIDPEDLRAVLALLDEERARVRYGWQWNGWTYGIADLFFYGPDALQLPPRAYATISLRDQGWRVIRCVESPVYVAHPLDALAIVRANLGDDVPALPDGWEDLVK